MGKVSNSFLKKSVDADKRQIQEKCKWNRKMQNMIYEKHPFKNSAHGNTKKKSIFIVPDLLLLF